MARSKPVQIRHPSSRVHKCHAQHCRERIPSGKIFCADHALLLPGLLLAQVAAIEAWKFMTEAPASIRERNEMAWIEASIAFLSALERPERIRASMGVIEAHICEANA